MKTTVHRLPTRTATVPHFIALLGVLHEAATRGLSLLPEAPAGWRAARPGHRPARLYPPSAKAPAR